MLSGPQPKGAHQRRKFTLDILYNLPKARKSKFLDALLTGPREPRYGLVMDTPGTLFKNSFFHGES
jgi:hypothetical protein